MSGNLTILNQSLKHLNIAPPKAVADAIELAAKVNALANSIAPAPNGLLGATIAAALLAGRDPAADKEVQRLRTLESILPLAGPNVRAWAEANIIAALTENTDVMLEAWRAASVTAGENLTATFELVGDVELNDSETFLRHGPEGAQAWANARTAVDTLKNLAQAWAALAELTHFGPNSGYPVLRLAELDADTLDKVGRTADAWTLVRAGIHIELADRATMPQRIAFLADGRQEQIEIQADRQQAAESRAFKTR